MLKIIIVVIFVHIFISEFITEFTPLVCELFITLERPGNLRLAWSHPLHEQGKTQHQSSGRNGTGEFRVGPIFSVPLPRAHLHTRCSAPTWQAASASDCTQHNSDHMSPHRCGVGIHNETWAWGEAHLDYWKVLIKIICSCVKKLTVTMVTHGTIYLVIMRTKHFVLIIPPGYRVAMD